VIFCATLLFGTTKHAIKEHSLMQMFDLHSKSFMLNRNAFVFRPEWVGPAEAQCAAQFHAMKRSATLGIHPSSVEGFANPRRQTNHHRMTIPIAYKRFSGPTDRHFDSPGV
jgi:hypothetical protein